MTEQWKPVVGYEGFYEVSNLARVRSVKRRVLTNHGAYRTVPSKILSPVNSQGYRLVMLNAAAIGKKELARVHRLVANAFIGQPQTDLHQVHHIDGNRANNLPSNLEWVTPRENMHHNMKRGTAPRGDTHGSKKLSSAGR